MLNFNKKFFIKEVPQGGYINSVILGWKQNYSELHSKPFVVQFKVKTRLYKYV